ncbi:hypothetical protein [Gorillibacterium sp. sgz5001074]|uniref:hypothetical protein n=1 Tax=Gorillibacterium sp. sgz5001074 TaxID=3446695 RepID=UPI003F67E18C
MKRWKNILYTGLALGMLGYAVPRLGTGGGLTSETVFSAVWICFALLVISANLHHVLGVDAEERERLRQVKRMRGWQAERRMMSRIRVGKTH